MAVRVCVWLMCVALTISGCAIQKPKFYAVDRPRVDQANTGNAGYLAGQGSQGNATPIAGRPTRRIYVWEFDKKKKSEVSKTVTPAAEAAPAATEGDQLMPSFKSTTMPYSQGEGDVQSVPSEKVTQYTVEKDDTLQKISKKVYGSFGKWTEIYDANKDVIKNPNFVKPGTILKIPQE